MPEGVGEFEPALVDALSSTCFVIPAHNEAAVIGDVLTSLESLPCRVVVVDDGSTDDTYAICLDRPVAVLHHSTNLGQGAALQTGITYAVATEGTRFVVTFDADGQHGTDSVVSLISAVAGGGPRRRAWARGSPAHRTRATIPRARRILLKCAVAFTRVTAGLPVTDTHNGLRAFTVRCGRSSRHQARRHGARLGDPDDHPPRAADWCEVPVTISYSDYSRGKGQRSAAAMDIVWDLVMGRIR